MYEYDFHTYSVRRKRSKKKIVVSIGFCLFALLIFFSSIRFVSPIGSHSTAFFDTITNDQNHNLEKVVQESLAGATGRYAVLIKHLHRDETYAFNGHEVFSSASLYKLWLMAVAYEQLENEGLKESDPLRGDIASLNRKFGIASESAEFTKGEVNVTVNSALTQMITISHNYAALLLTEKVKLSKVKTFLEKHGFSESTVGTENHNPETTAHDSALFFEKLIQGEFANETNTERMLDLLKAQRLNKKLPKYLPVGTTVAHKTGELGLLTHNAGIVYSPKGEYVIVVLSETPYPPNAEEHIALLSKAVYQYMSAQ